MSFLDKLAFWKKKDDCEKAVGHACRYWDHTSEVCNEDDHAVWLADQSLKELQKNKRQWIYDNWDSLTTQQKTAIQKRLLKKLILKSNIDFTDI